MPLLAPSNLKQNARRSLARAAAASGFLSRLERRMAGGWTILTYHRILRDPASYPFESLVTPLDAFRAQVQWLARTCLVLPVREAIDRSIATEDGRPLVSITFDDGYVDGITLAAPILREADLRATYFITTGPVGGRERLWFDEAGRRLLAAPPATKAEAWREVSTAGTPTTLPDWMAALKQLSPRQRGHVIELLPPTVSTHATADDRLMSPQELRQLSSEGHEIASHTVTHPLLPQLDDAALEHELRMSREHLAEWLGAPPEGFCYPNGDHDDRVAAAARAAGYRYACCTRPGRNDSSADPMSLKRIDMNPGRTRGRKGRHDLLAFRAEVSLLHHALR